MSDNVGKMLDHDDDSFENINILRMLMNLYLQNVKRYLRISWPMQVAWWPHSNNVNTYLVLVLPSNFYPALPCPPSFLVCSFFFNKKVGSPLLYQITKYDSDL